MTQVPAWFERKFDFSFGIDLLPNVKSRLRGTPARLEELLNQRSSAVLTAKPDGRWSAQEHAGHLLELESLWVARIEDFAQRNETLTAADLTNRQTDAANYNAQPRETVLTKFRSAREALLARVDSLDAAPISHTMPHPRLKVPMRLIDHLFFVAEHDDHHLAAIYEILHPHA